MVGEETGSYPVKTHGQELQEALEPRHPPKRNVITKRSYKRALTRIRNHGFTWYKGRLLSGNIQHGQQTSSPQISNSTNLPPHSVNKRRRLTCLTWNAGGMSISDWDHFQQWIDHQHLDIITLQETHWSHTSSWLQHRYHCVHSGGQARQAGVLTLIAKTLCGPDDSAWDEIIPGRLLHVRVFGQSRTLDILNVYQFVHRHSTLRDRQLLWDKLHATCSTLPKRNTWFLMGDFNTSLQKTSNAVGLADFLQEARRQRSVSQ